MSPRPSAYRDALQVSPERIAALNDDELSLLMRELLNAQAYRCQADRSEITVNTEGIAKDDGSDGWSPKPAIDDEWLGRAPTCWQFKAGTAGEPAKLAGEVKKRIPSETLTSGGRFVLVASGSTNGKKGELGRLAILHGEATALNLPTAGIDVLGSERLTQWCNQLPAVAARWAGRPDGLWLLESWLQSEEHRVEWQATSAIQTNIVERQADLGFTTGSVRHLHIQGLPGVGKTRLALEICRDATWKSAVVYIRQAADVRLSELIDGAASDNGVRLLVVADEVQAEQLRPLRDSLDRAQGRIRLITIGHSKTPDPSRIPAISVLPLDAQSMAHVVTGWYPAMPSEHVDFVVRFADGFVRLARLAANEVMRNPSIDMRGLLDQDHIRAFLDGMLGAATRRRALHVVAVLTSVGWTGDRQGEGEAIARHLGLDWNEVRADVDDFDRRLGIAPRGGRLRYISPTPLAIHLAVEAWTTFPDLMRSLPEVLPTDEARQAYYDRLETIASNPQAKRFARDELAFFFHVEDFLDPRSARRWSALAAADPDLAALNIARALESSPEELRLRLSDGARREVVRTLVRLAWRASAFRDSVLALALLAEAENETWANNASAEFVAKFQLFLGGTAMPYEERLTVLDEITAYGDRPRLTRLVIRALARVGVQQETRTSGEPVSDGAQEPEWHPTPDERIVCTEAALARLTRMCRDANLELLDDLQKAAGELAMLLREDRVRASVAGFFDAIRIAYPGTREALRRSIADVIFRERKYWNELPRAEMEALDELHRHFEDRTTGGKLHQYVGAFHDDNDDDDGDNEVFSELARELVKDRAVLSQEWAWLTSGRAAEGWRFGEALAAADTNGELEPLLTGLPGTGRDLRLLCGYVSKRRATQGDAWFDHWMALQAKALTATPFLVEVTWRCGATTQTAKILAEVLRRGEADTRVADQLGFGRWQQNIAKESLLELLQALVDTGHRSAAIAALDARLDYESSDLGWWDEFALSLVMSSELIRSAHMTSHHWKEVARRLIPRHAVDIGGAILRAQADRSSGTWFTAHSEAREILEQCIDAAPAGMWHILAECLGSPGEAAIFSIGLPRILDRMPSEDVRAWIASKPKERASVVARLISKNFASDTTLGSLILGEYGDDPDVGGSFFSAYVSGSWVGPASARWRQLAESLQEIANRTKFPKLRRWAQKSSAELRLMSERDQEREAEEAVRWR